MSKCVCGSGLDGAECCDPILAGQDAPGPERLMRARFAAFAKGDMDFLAATLAPEMQGEFERAEVEASARKVTPVGVQVLRVEEFEQVAKVEYIASFKVQGQLHPHHELATFRRQDGRWLYVDGQVNPKGEPVRVDKTGRNDPCPCGSGKKYKKCCGSA